jgi:hypothetical protein
VEPISSLRENYHLDYNHYFPKNSFDPHYTPHALAGMAQFFCSRNQFSGDLTDLGIVFNR